MKNTFFTISVMKHIKFDFAIVACGYKFVFDEFYDEVLKIASLHIYGENDQQVAPGNVLFIFQLLCKV